MERKDLLKELKLEYTYKFDVVPPRPPMMASSESDIYINLLKNAIENDELLTQDDVYNAFENKADLIIETNPEQEREQAMKLYKLGGRVNG